MMDTRKLVIHETAKVAIGVGICLAVMYGVFALLGHFDWHVLVGGIIGSVLSILNFFFMAVNVNNAADKAVNQDVKGGKSLIRFSYTTRLAAIFVILFAFAKSGVTNPLASVLPIAFVRPVITVAEFFNKK